MRIAIFEDNKQFRESLEMLVNLQTGMTVAGVFKNTMHLVDDIKSCSPDLVIMDIDLPGTPGYDAAKIIKQYFPAIDIVMLTVFDDADNIFKSLQNGAIGYLLKNTDPKLITDALLEVKKGGSPITPSIARKVVDYFTRQQKPRKAEYILTPKEVQILNALVEGSSYLNIADSFAISIDTVRSHIRHIYEKLEVNSRIQAINKARNEHII